MNKGLVADIGGTNVRFALIDTALQRPSFETARKYSTKDHANIGAAARAYLLEQNFEDRLSGLVFGVAGPVKAGEINLTNAGWTISEKDLYRNLDVAFAQVVNDFETLAEAVPVFEPEDLQQIGPLPFDGRRGGTVAIIGPGTGLGIGGLVHGADAMLPLVTEGGHAAFAPSDDLEAEILKILRQTYGDHVSNERILSGPGLLNLYRAMAQIEGKSVPDSDPTAITRAARQDKYSFEAAVFERFCAILGAVAGDVALIMGARNGVLIAGGIMPDAIDFLAESDFRRRFEDKGRFAGYMEAISTAVIVDEHAGLRGAATILRNELTARE